MSVGLCCSGLIGHTLIIGSLEELVIQLRNILTTIDQSVKHSLVVVLPAPADKVRETATLKEHFEPLFSLDGIKCQRTAYSL